MDIISFKENITIFSFEKKTDQPNVIYIAGNKKAVLVDAGPSPEFAQRVLSYLSEHHLKYPTHVILTHYHWDHSFGICGYDACVICSSYTNERLKAFLNLDFLQDDFISDELINEFSVEHINLEYPTLDIHLKEGDILVDAPLKMDLGGISLEIKPVVSSHTEGSLIVLVEDLLLLGDSSCPRIIGMEFVEDIPKLTSFLERIKAIPCKYILEGHSDRISKESFVKEIEDRIKNR